MHPQVRSDEDTHRVVKLAEQLTTAREPHVGAERQRKKATDLFRDGEFRKLWRRSRERPAGGSTRLEAASDAPRS